MAEPLGHASARPAGAADGQTAGSADGPSLGELVATATRDLSTLVRKEIELAKLEVSGEVKKAGLGAGLFGGAGFLVFLATIFLSIALAFGIGHFIGLGWGFLVVGVLYLLLAGILALVGKKQISKVGPPARTIETVKDDIAWARHPTSVPDERLLA